MKRLLQRVLMIVVTLGVMLLGVPTTLTAEATEYVQNQSLSWTTGTYSGHTCVIIRSSNYAFYKYESGSYSEGGGWTSGWDTTMHLSGTSQTYSTARGMTTTAHDTYYIWFPNTPKNTTVSFSVYFTLSGGGGGRYTDNYSYTGTSNTINCTVNGDADIILSAPSVTLSDVTSDSIRVSWGSVSYASSYTLEYATNSSFSGGSSFNLSVTSKVLSGLSPNTTYYIRVKANTSATGYVSSGYTQRSIKTLQLQMDTSPILNEVKSLSFDSLSIEFTTVDNATGYVIEYSTNTSFTNKKTLTVT